MRRIDCVLFEPVGCLAEFPPEPFQEIAARYFHRRKTPPKSASRAYWHLLNLMEASGPPPDLESFELEAVRRATLYEDVPPALAELQSMGIRLCVASSLSRVAVASFLDRHRLGDRFAAVHTRDDAAGIKSASLRAALAPVDPRNAMFLADTLEALKAAKTAGVHPVLMMNDPDESRRLALQNPAGGIVSLHELPDFLRLVAARS